MAIQDETRIIKEFPECQWCGSKEKASQAAFGEMEKNGKLQPGFLSLVKGMMPPPLKPSTAIATLMTDVLITHVDICLGCGRERITRLEMQKAQVQVQPNVPQQGFRNYPGQKGGFIPR